MQFAIIYKKVAPILNPKTIIAVPNHFPKINPPNKAIGAPNPKKGNTHKITKKRKDKDKNGSTPIVQGLGYRSFTRVFQLAPYVEVTELKLKDGILTIWLERVLPEELQPKILKIAQHGLQTSQKSYGSIDNG